MKTPKWRVQLNRAAAWSRVPIPCAPSAQSFRFRRCVTAVHMWRHSLRCWSGRASSRKNRGRPAHASRNCFCGGPSGMFWRVVHVSVALGWPALGTHPEACVPCLSLCPRLTRVYVCGMYVCVVVCVAQATVIWQEVMDPTSGTLCLFSYQPSQPPFVPLGALPEGCFSFSTHMPEGCSEHTCTVICE